MHPTFNMNPHRRNVCNFNQLIISFLIIFCLLMIVFETFLIREEIERTFTSKSIFFIETRSGKRHLTPLEACSIEAAARLHPKNRVVIYNVDGMHLLSDPFVAALTTKFTNLHFFHLDLDELFSGTPLQTWHIQKQISDSSFPVEHLSDAARIALIWKRGGIYLDSDVISLKPLNRFTNTLGVEIFDTICNGVLIFEERHFFLFLYMQRFASNFNGSVFDHQGPIMMTDMLKQLSYVDSLSEVINKPTASLGIDIAPAWKFFPVNWNGTKALLLPPEEVSVDLSKSFAIHIYRNVHNHIQPEVNDKSLLSAIAQRSCPISYQIVLKDGILKDFYFKDI